MPLSSDSKLRASLDAYHASDWWLGFKLIKPITKENLLKGTGAVLHISADEALGRIAAKDEPQGLVMPFGKYKGRTKNWIEDNDERYAEWAAENLPIWKKL